MFASAIFPDRWACAGLPLHTHTLGHALLLQRLGSPFAGRPGNAPAAGGFGQLVTALYICTRPWRRALRGVDSRVSRWWIAWHMGRVAEHGEVTARAELHAYLSDAWPSVKWWTTPQAGSRASGADYIHSLLTGQRLTGLSLDQALDVPLGVAIWDLAQRAEREGVITIRTEHDEDMLELYEKLTASGALPRAGDVVRRN